MSTIAFLDESLSLRIVLTMLHFLWQGSAIALAVVAVGWLLRRASAQARYVMNVAGMIVMVVCLTITFTLIDVPRDVEIAAVSSEEEDGFQALANREHPPTEPLIDETNVGATALPDSADEFTKPIETPSSDSRRVSANTIASANIKASERSFQTSDAQSQVAANPVLENSWLGSASPYFLWLYSVGVGLMMLRLAIGLLGGHRLRRKAIPVSDARLLGSVKRLAKQVGLRSAPMLAYCEQISVPVVVGTTRAMILLPASLVSGLSPNQLGILLTHELAHIRRHDPLINLLQRMLEAALFFHPAVWLVSRRVSVERENAADDMVVSLGCGRVHYADALVHMAELSAPGRNAMFVHHSTVIAASGSRASELKRRVLRLLAHDHQSQFSVSGIGLATLAVFVCLAAFTPLLLTTWAGNAAPPPESKRASIDDAKAEADGVIEEEKQQQLDEQQQKIAQQQRDETEATNRKRLAMQAANEAQKQLHRFLLLGEQGNDAKYAAAFLEGALSELHDDLKHESRALPTPLRLLAAYQHWPRRRNESSLEMVRGLVKSFEESEEGRAYLALTKQFEDGMGKPWPHDWRARREYWLKFTADVIDSSTVDFPFDIWHERILDDAKHAFLYRHAYLAIALARPLDDLFLEEFEPLIRQADSNAAILDMSHILIAASNGEVPADNVDRVWIRDRLVNAIKRQPPSVERSWDLVRKLSALLTRLEGTDDEKLLFDTLLTRMDARSFLLFCQWREVPFTNAQISAAFFRKPVAVSPGKVRVDQLVRQLESMVALPLWVDEKVWKSDLTIDVDKKIEGPWLKVVEQALAKSPYRLAMLSDDVVWIGPQTGLKKAESVLSRARGSLPPAHTPLGSQLRETTQFEFADVPLDEACDYLSDLHSVRFQFGLDELGINPATPITYAVQHLPLYLALIEISASIGANLEAINDTIFVGGSDYLDGWRNRAAAHRLKMAKLKLASGSAAKVVTQPTEIEFVEAPLEEVIDWFEQLHEIEVKLVGDPESIKVNQECVVNLEIKDVPLGWALTLILAEHDLDWAAVGNAIHVGFAKDVDAEVAAEKLERAVPKQEADKKEADTSKLNWPTRLNGQVTDRSEKALGNARVKLSLITHIRNRSNFARRTLKTVEATTDENGRYEIDTAGFPAEVPSPYSIEVTGSAPDHASWETWHFYSGPSGKIATQLPTLRLPRGQVITGQCVDSRGTPVIAAIEGVSSLPSAGVWQRQHGATDMKGNFHIVAPKDADVALWFLSDLVGYKRVEVPAAHTDRPLRVVIEQGTSLSGIVVDARDEPVAGTLVVLEQFEPAMSSGHVHRLRFAAKTDDRGRFQLPPGRGDFNCFLAQASYTSQRAREPAMFTKNPAPAFAPIAVSLNGQSAKQEIKLRTSAEAKVSGIVRFGDGRPARGVSLHIYSTIRKKGSAVELDETVTDETGRYVVRVPVSSPNITIRAYASNRTAIPADYAPGKHTESSIRFEKITKDIAGADFVLLTNEERKEREAKKGPKPVEAFRPDGVIKGKIILRSGPKLDGSPNELKLLVDKPDKAPILTVYVGTSTLEFRRAESKAADGLEEATIGEKGEKIYLHKEADVTSEHIAEARVVNDSSGKPAIEIRFTMAGSTKFAKVTTEHMGKRLAIVFNGKVISAPTIRSKISTKALITGNFTKEEADGIAKAIMKSKEDKKKKEDESKSSESDLDDTSKLKKDSSPIADIKPVFQPLGHLPDLAKYSMGHGISADGNAVIGNVRNQRTAFRWTRENGMQALPMLEDGVHHFGQCVSKDGTVIAGFCNHTSRWSEFSTAFIWTEKEGTVSLGHLPGGTRELTAADLRRPRMYVPAGAGPGLPSPRFGMSQAHGMSASGAQVVGASSSKDGMQAFVWTKMAGMRGLGDLDGGEFLSVAQGISADGRVIVGESQSGRGYEAVRWVDGKGPLSIGDFAGGSFNSRAYATSADGSIIVGCGETEKGYEAFRWEDGKMISLGELPGGRHHSSARSISADGSVIVGDSHSDRGNEAFVWDAKNGMRSLRDVLSNSSTSLAEQLQGWKLTEARGISADGRKIAGVGVNPNENWEAWVISLPSEN